MQQMMSERRKMELSTRDKALAGQVFRFEVIGGRPPYTKEVFIGQKIFLKRKCPDEPCHEMFVIPESAEEMKLRIRITDANFQRIEEVMEIKGSSSSRMRGGAT